MILLNKHKIYFNYFLNDIINLKTIEEWREKRCTLEPEMIPCSICCRCQAGPAAVRDVSECKLTNEEVFFGPERDSN